MFGSESLRECLSLSQWVFDVRVFTGAHRATKMGETSVVGQLERSQAPFGTNAGAPIWLVRAAGMYVLRRSPKKNAFLSTHAPSLC